VSRGRVTGAERRCFARAGAIRVDSISEIGAIAAGSTFETSINSLPFLQHASPDANAVLHLHANPNADAKPKYTFKRSGRGNL